MKALIVANLAGFASFLINDIKTLQDMGYKVSFVANANKLSWNDTKEKLDNLGVEFKQVDFESKNPFSNQNLKAYKQLKNILETEKYDLIHCHTPIAGLITRLAAVKCRRKGTCVIYTSHGFAFTADSSKKSWLIYRTMEDFGSRFCDAIITINKEDYNNAKKMHCKKVFYINGVGVDTEKYRDVDIKRSQYRKSIGVEDDQTMILSVGELSERKNHIVIIDALALLADKGDFVYVICGNGIDGGTGKLLQERAKEKSVNLLLLGFRFDIPEIIHCSDIGAIPSTREGLGLAGVQSLAAGVPLVGSGVQGILDYVIDGKTGYLCKPHDSKAFAKAILKLYKQNDLVKNKMAVNCKKMSKRFDKQVSVQQMRKIYLKMLNK